MDALNPDIAFDSIWIAFYSCAFSFRLVAQHGIQQRNVDFECPL